MIKAILEGQKTQTRRIIKPQPLESWMKYQDWNEYYKNGKKNLWIKHPISPIGKELKCPYGTIGDKLWVRESFAKNHPILDNKFSYKANSMNPKIRKWQPSIFMPRKASRITLEIKNIRVQRIRDISLEDAEREGVKVFSDDKQYGDVSNFADLWITINGADSWKRNDWVWCITFTQINKEN